jgi:arginase family enzyme
MLHFRLSSEGVSPFFIYFLPLPVFYKKVMNDILRLYFEKPEVAYLPTAYLPEKQRLDSQLVDNDCKVAIIGVGVDTNSLTNKGSVDAPDAIRRQLYSLRGFSNLRIADLGNLKKGKGLNDTFFAIKDVVAELTEQGIVPVIIGGSQDLTFPMFNGLKEGGNPINLTVIDSRLDLGDGGTDFNSHSFLQPILEDEQLDQFEPLCHQSYFVSEDSLNWLKKRQGDMGVRLGIARSRLPNIEPYLRDTDLLSVDMNAVRQSDAPASALATPNGLFADEAAQLMLYAGYADRMKAFGLFELNPQYDRNEQSAATAAQMIWHFLEGVSMRAGDFPARAIDGYAKYIVQQRGEKNVEFVFYSNPSNDRWWLEVPVANEQKRIISCTFEDYNFTKAGGVPERWIRFYLR